MSEKRRKQLSPQHSYLSTLTCATQPHEDEQTDQVVDRLSCTLEHHERKSGSLADAEESAENHPACFLHSEGPRDEQGCHHEGLNHGFDDQGIGWPKRNPQQMQD